MVEYKKSEKIMKIMITKDRTVVLSMREGIVIQEKYMGMGVMVLGMFASCK